MCMMDIIFLPIQCQLTDTNYVKLDANNILNRKENITHLIEKCVDNISSLALENYSHTIFYGGNHYIYPE